MLKNQRPPKSLYYRAEKHASTRVATAYGLFLGALLLIGLGISYFLGKFSERPAQVDAPQIMAETPPAAPEVVREPEKKAESLETAQTAPTTETAARDHSSDVVEGSGQPLPDPWFYTIVGRSPKPGTAVTEIQRGDNKFTLLLLASPKLPAAQKYRNNLAKQGLHAFVQKTRGANGKPQYLVQFGVYRSKRKATSEKGRLADQYAIRSDVAPLNL